MSDYILRLIHCLTKLFVKKKQIKESPSKYSTPLRVPSRTGLKGCRNPDVLPVLRQTPVPRKVPRSCPIIRCPSQISVKRFGSEDDISFRPDNFIRNRPFNSSLQNRSPEPFDCSFEVDNAAKSDNPNFPQVPAYKSSKTSLDYFCMAGDRLQTPIKPYKRIFSAKKQFNLSTQYPNIGFPPKFNSASSKIPVRNLNRYSIRMNGDYSKLPPHRLRGRYTFVSPPMHLSDDLQASGEAPDIPEFKSSDISNWIAYRNDTSARFERMFKALSKKKHAIGNLIDSTSHAQWLQLAGIMADRDAAMFKQFAGGKVVLTCGEYKFLIDKMCTIHDLDYWDVLRKMATFQDEDQN